MAEALWDPRTSGAHQAESFCLMRSMHCSCVCQADGKKWWQQSSSGSPRLREVCQNWFLSTAGHVSCRNFLPSKLFPEANCVWTKQTFDVAGFGPASMRWLAWISTEMALMLFSARDNWGWNIGAGNLSLFSSLFKRVVVIKIMNEGKELGLPL